MPQLFDNTMLDILDGERVSKASKTMATNLKKIYDTKTAFNTGFGGRIDLILATKDVELSASERKRKKPPAVKCLQQQANNIRINKAILRYFLDLSVSEADILRSYHPNNTLPSPRYPLESITNNLYIQNNTHVDARKRNRVTMNE